MKYFFTLLVFCGVVINCSAEKYLPTHQVIITNTTSFALKDKPVTIERKFLSKIPSGDYYPLLLSLTGDTIPSQLDDMDGDDRWDELFFVKSIAAYTKDTLNLHWVTVNPNFARRTSIRFGVRKTRDAKVLPVITDTFYADQLPGVIGYQRYQTDGPTWENDKVGFRLYLDGRNSIDVFGKTKPGITPENVGIGKDGVTEYNYSTMQDWGTDILGVGNSVGIGGVSLLIGDSLARLGITEQDKVNNVDSTICRIVTEGPVRSQLQFDYLNWKIGSRNYDARMNTRIWPGIYGFKNSVQVNHLKGDETLVVGLVNSKTDQSLTEINVNDKWVVLLTHDKQTVNKDGWLGLALVLPKENYLGYMEAPKTGSVATTYLGKLKIENNKPVEYFAIAGWELSDASFRDANYFKKYVTDMVDQLMATLSVTVN